jgi:YD repeat-containing protein
MKVKYLVAIFLSYVLLSVVNVFGQTTFYYDGSGNLNMIDQTGDLIQMVQWHRLHANFTANNQIFQIRNTTSVTSSANWTVSGTNSKIVLGDPSVAAITLTHSGGNWNGTVDVAAASSGTNTLVLSSTDGNTPTLGTLNGASTVQYTRGGTQTVQSNTYGNLLIGGSSGTKTAADAITVNGTLTINTSRILNMSTFALSGTLTPAGTGELRTANTSSTPIPANDVWTGAVTYNSAIRSNHRIRNLSYANSQRWSQDFFK